MSNARVRTAGFSLVEFITQCSGSGPAQKKATSRLVAFYK